MKTAIQLLVLFVALVSSVDPGHAQSVPGAPGYVLVLRFDSGKVEQHLFHAADDRSFIWFRGEEMTKDKK